MAITEVLKQAAENWGASWYQIAKDSGVENSTLHRFLSGERSIRLDTVEKLAKYFGLELKPKTKPRKRKK